ncbi:MAG TPA: FHA domain-containing protein [Polyangiales bacterium]
MQPTQAPARWEPATLLEALLLGRYDPLVLIPSGYLLLVRLDDFSRELALGLSAPRSRPTTPREVKPTLGLLSKVEVAPGQAAQPERTAQAGPPRELPRQLRQSPCYLVSIPGDRVTPRTVTVGRAPANDIVLRHPSVSALHAHLGSGPELWLRDAQSRNQTSVNDEPLRGPQLIYDGDLLKFGAVLARICSVVSLIQQLQSPTSP